MYLAIDWGKKRIGMAVGEKIPRGIGVVDGSKSFDHILGQIKRICDEEKVKAIIFGLPERDSGEGELGGEIREFAQKLKKELKIKIIFEPEQYSSLEAKRLLIEQGKYKARDKESIDQMSAMIILEQFLNHQNAKK